MSERQENKIMAVYYILVTAGVKISKNMEKTVAEIESRKAAAYVAGVKA